MRSPILKAWLFLASLTIIYSFSDATWQSKFVKADANGALTYTPDRQGNIIPDFSHVGYHKGNKPLPELPVVKTLSPSNNDEQTIQDAIDELSKAPLNKNGFRGTILLRKGVYKIPGSIKIGASGIVLRGEGNGTRLIATGKGQRSLVMVNGKGIQKEVPDTRRKIADSFVPVGAKSFKLNSASGLNIGDKIIVYRPGTQNWISDLKMDQIEVREGTKQWQAKEYDLNFEREITRVDGNTIHIDNPIVMAIDAKYGGGEIYKYSFDGRISETGVENLRFESEYASDTDEDHGWIAVEIGKAENCWVKNVVSYYFGFSCVSVRSDAKFITVKDSKCLDAKSIITGSRRYSFNNDGQLNLFMNLETTEGRHDFVTGARVLGPNVFYNCKSTNTHADIGPHHRWAVGTLFDNVTTDGEINVQDRGRMGTGHGWAGGNQVLWNCTVKAAIVQNPWTSANNYAIGLKGNRGKAAHPDRPEGIWEGQNKPGLVPQSLYMAQLKARQKSNL